jgi:cytidine deaminase
MKKTLEIIYDEYAHYSELDKETQALVNEAYEICHQAYAPYSNFYVGAVALLDDGTIVRGNNQENIAYPSGLCAERVALFYAGANLPKNSIQKLVIVAKGDLIEPDACLSPCGSCRQVISESERRQSKPIEITLVSENGRTFVFQQSSDLLVFPFGMK